MQWLSGLNLRLNEVKDKFGKLNQVIVIKLKAQWLSGLNLRLNDLLETYSTVRGWTDEVKIIQFLLLVYSQLCGGELTKRKSFDFLLLILSR